ncbi:MAG: ABC transporter permease subunit/CPBP intramembrane protease [Phycisphaerae bacterium]
MTFGHRIATIYAKELLDILRDRRTLIAMVVVPIVLYPLLMLGSIQAVSYQAASLEQETFIVGVTSEAQWDMLKALIVRDAAWIEAQSERFGRESAAGQALPRPLTDDVRWVALRSVATLEQYVRDRKIQVAVRFRDNKLIDSSDRTNHVELSADEEEIRSRNARDRIRDMIERVADRTVARRLTDADLSKAFIAPFEVTTVDLSTPSSVLGEILPLILVLMTVTGAIYPAIDVTAGERERGTLESLMVCPVPHIDLIVGKFFVVTTVAIVGATLNLGSVTATVYFGGFKQVIASNDGSVPLGRMALILLSLIPFAVFMSAIMMAVCCCARTFKEAQNYVTPVILAVLVPGGLAALPGTSLGGVMLVVPVSNMVLLSREMLLGAPIPFGSAAIVLLSTTLYAASAVAVAANVFGRESVAFADAGSMKASLSRRLIKPAARPPVSMALLLTALLFPTWFFVQTALSPSSDEGGAGQLTATAVWMPVLFVVLPVSVLWYWKVDLVGGFACRVPRMRYIAAGVLIGVAAWVPVHEITVLQGQMLPMPERTVEALEAMERVIRSLHPAQALMCLAVVPALCEELLFRGLLLTGLATALRPASAVIASAVVFGVFHFALFRFVPTTALGVVLGLLCWRARSIVPGVIAHMLHNGVTLSALYWPWRAALGIPDDPNPGHLPLHVLGAGSAVFLIGLFVTTGERDRVPRRMPSGVTVP